MYAGRVVSWSSRTQRYVTLSSKSECVALAEVTREVIFSINILIFIHPDREVREVPIFEDNNSAT